jgi:transcriptional regulator with XRE-family HTH domain
MRKPSADITSTLSVNIKKLRSEKGLSQEQLADKCGLHRTYVGAVERGERNVTLSSLELIASALDVDVPSLLSNNLGESTWMQE